MTAIFRGDYFYQNATRMATFHYIVVILFACNLLGTESASREPPVLNWIPRSDWINVKTNFAAVGNGIADDTNALQAAIDSLNDTSPGTLYFPPGTYKITRTLWMINKQFSTLIGHGGATVISWYGDSSPGGNNSRMFVSDGNPLARFVGLTWEGNNNVDHGFLHAAKVKFESRVLHEYETFRNIRERCLSFGSYYQKFATSESQVSNSLFINCGRALFVQDPNYYNEIITNCDFYDNRVGVTMWYFATGSIRRCHFENSTFADFDISEPSYTVSIRTCTSSGSRMFISTAESNNQKFTMHNCYVEKWTNTNGTVVTKTWNPLLIIDNTFAHPPNSNPPITLIPLDKYTHRVDKIFSGNSFNGSTALYDNRSAKWPVWNIERPEPTDYKLSAPVSFRVLAPETGSKVFDAVTNFNATKPGVDAGVAIQNCVNAAKQEGNGAVCYLPKGSYKVSTTVVIDGANYALEGAGYITRLDWKNTGPGTIVRVESPTNVHLRGMWFYKEDGFTGSIAIHHVRKEGVATSYTVYDRIYGVSSGFERISEPRDSLLIDGLGQGDSVNIRMLNGMLRVRNSARADILIEFLNALPFIVEGDEPVRDGLLTVLYSNSMNLQVYDNQNVIIGDYYYEQSGDWGKHPDINAVYVEGKPNSPPGRVVLQGAKCMMYDSNVLGTINNYRGLFSYVLPSIGLDNKAFTERKVNQVGDNPVDVLFLSVMNQDLKFNGGGPEANFYYYPDRTVNLTQGDPAAAAIPSVKRVLDAFADMGRQDLSFNAPNTQSPGAVGPQGFSYDPATWSYPPGVYNPDGTRITSGSTLLYQGAIVVLLGLLNLV